MAPQANQPEVAQAGVAPPGVAVVVGVGPGLGAALVRRFAQGGHPVAMVARSREFMEGLAAEVKAAGGRTLAVTADVGDEAGIGRAFDTVRSKLGAPEVLLYNAGSGNWGTITEITPEQYEDSWRANAYGAFLCAKQAATDMIKNKRGVMLFTGATAGIKAGPMSAAFGPAKFAVRGLAQSLARDLGPRGIHVAYVNVDGTIDIPHIRSRMPSLKDEDVLKPAAIAEAYWHLANQDPSAWTQELDLRPFKEKF
jgi:NAD(P)-dependent dehydrogenase (short-subunit alcohol dehydrogenase family)